MFLSNAMPELHEEGYIKYQSNVSKMRNVIQTFRCDDSYSALYAAHEDTFIKIASGKNNGEMSEVIYRLDPKEKTLLDNFMYVRNTGLLFNKGNVDQNGKATLVDPDTNRPIYITEGLIPQVERFASKYAYNKLSMEVFRTALAMLNEKAQSATGNKYTFICNEKFWNDLQIVLGDYLVQAKTDGAYLWSHAANDYVKVGATFNAYEFAGKQVIFKVERAFSREFGYDKGYCLCLDLTADKTSAMPPIACFTLKGGEYITNQVVGVGGLDGLTSGQVSTPVAGSKLVAWGYAGIAVFNPYRSFIIREI